MLTQYKIFNSSLITVSLLTFIISLIVCLGGLYLLEPSWVKVIDKKTEKSKISWIICFTASFSFASLIALFVLINMSVERNTPIYNAEQQEYKIPLEFPSEEVALARYL